jgi:hypothetical protein
LLAVTTATRQVAVCHERQATERSNGNMPTVSTASKRSIFVLHFREICQASLNRLLLRRVDLVLRRLVLCASSATALRCALSRAIRWPLRRVLRVLRSGRSD